MTRSRTLPPPAALALVAALAAAVSTLSASAPALGAPQLTTYAGLHPLGAHMGDFCYIDVPHVHPGSPIDLRVYRTLSDASLLFVGDPVALGYDGTKLTYAGPHLLAMPDLPTTAGVLYCYLQGPHYHAFAPAGGQFTFKDGVYWYMGPFGAEFDRDKQFVWVNEVRPAPRYHSPEVKPDAAPPGYKAPKVIDYQFPPPAVSLAPVKAPSPPPSLPAEKGKGGNGNKGGKKAALAAKAPAGAPKPGAVAAVPGGAKTPKEKSK